MSANDLRIASAMAQVALDLDTAGDRDEMLSRVTHFARETIQGVDFASISVRFRDGHLETFASTAEVINQADALQYALREGPCYETAATTVKAVATDDLSTDARWPSYGPAAAALGLRAQLAVLFYDNPQSRGALNLYSSTAATFAEQLPLAQLFARHAAIAMGHSYTVEGLKEALATRKSIGQALGIVMERYGLDEDRAFEFLLRVSQTGNVKLRNVAAQIVDEVNASGGDA
jgi:GAF domain-containing protein